MNTKMYMFIGISLVIGFLLGSMYFTKSNNEIIDVTAQTESSATKESCLADDCLDVENLEYPAGSLPDTVRNALNSAIDDEYKALARYDAVIAKFGPTRPFSMIRGAEQSHIASLKSIYDKYDITPPDNAWEGNTDAPDTITEACQSGVDAEIENASLYREELLPVVQDYPDIVNVFTNLMNASQMKHLPAFDRCN